MEKPIRVQRSRSKGSKLPPNTVCVTRGTKYGNRFKVGVDGTAEECVAKFAAEKLPYTHETGTMEEFYISQANLEEIKQDLAGKNIACWCKIGDPCHGDWLLNVANS